MPCLAVGHRGAALLAPENTLASMRRAVEVGVNELEIDLRLTSDGEIVIMHDAEVDRTTNGHGLVSDLSLTQVRDLDAGDGHRVPTFVEVLDATDLPLQVEIKDPNVIEPLVELLAGREADRNRLQPTSFDTDSVARVAVALPELQVGLISKATDLAVLDRAAALGATRVLVSRAGLTAELVEAAHEREFRIDTWPVNTPEQVRHVVGLGVDGFTTDDPRIIAAAGYRVDPTGLVEIGDSLSA